MIAKEYQSPLSLSLFCKSPIIHPFSSDTSSAVSEGEEGPRGSGLSRTAQAGEHSGQDASHLTRAYDTRHLETNECICRCLDWRRKLVPSGSPGSIGRVVPGVKFHHPALQV